MTLEGAGGRILRFEVPVDDQWHAVQLPGPILHVACRKARSVELWALDSGAPSEMRGFRVFGTGQPLPARVSHAGTALAPGGQLVWHLMETVDT
ncbi:hypothetical protein [Streptomyces sp. NPDC058653]|uniref:DUF7352 domain-containing protein n=1 Tax=Streptomyces sp. NPDC058653 TaxID=3346576 RepID=UPI00365B7E1A